MQEILEREIEKAYKAGLPRQEHPRQRLRLRRLRAPRRRRLRGGRRDRADRVARRQARAAAHQAAVPGRRRPLSVPDRGQQRRDALQRAAHRPQRRRSGSRRSVPRRTAGRSCSASAATSSGPGVYEASMHTTLRELISATYAQGMLRRPRRSRRSSPADRRCRSCSTSTSTRRPASTTSQKAGSLLGLGRAHRDGRHGLHGVAGDEPAALLPPRVVRQVHAVPRRRRLALQAAAAHRARRRAR